VIHLAYATVPNTSFDNPLADLLQNLPPTVELFSKVAERSGRLILVSSGGTVYGQAVQLPILENHPTNPISPYGVTKLTLEKYAHLYAVTKSLKVICVRPGNAYGVGQYPYIGQGFVSTAMASIRGVSVRRVARVKSPSLRVTATIIARENNIQMKIIQVLADIDAM
jgi:UDP-glucose 4-epimerase